MDIKLQRNLGKQLSNIEKGFSTTMQIRYLRRQQQRS